MAQFTVSERFNAPVDRVFSLFSDVGNAPAHVKGIKRVEVLTPGPVQTGTRFRETRVFMNKEATEEMEFTAFEPGRSYSIGCESHGARYLSVFRFEPEGNTTVVKLDFSVQPVTLMAKLMTPLSAMMIGAVKKCVLGDMKSLKAAAEGRS